MTKPPRRKAAKAEVKKVSPAVRQSPAKPIAGTRDLTALVERVVAIIEDARSRVVRTVNSEMVLAYWHIGREIVTRCRHE